MSNYYALFNGDPILCLPCCIVLYFMIVVITLTCALIISGLHHQIMKKSGVSSVVFLLITLGCICYLIMLPRRINLSLLNNSDYTSEYPQLPITQSTGHKKQRELVLDSKAISERGHILLYSSYEEQTNGARNLWHLQMWAESVKMRVVEPFAEESMFGIIGALPHVDKALRFSDYYDIDKWNKLVNTRGGSSLVQWEEFVSSASRKVIVLYTLIRHNMKPWTFTYGENDVKSYHPGKYEQVLTEDLLWLKQNFNVIRVVTLVRNEGWQAKSPEEFTSHVFGPYNPTEVTLVIVNWLGMDGNRINLDTDILKRIHVDYHRPQSSPDISPSQRVLSACKKYVSKYIGTGKYVGIVFITHTVLEYGTEGNFKKKGEYLLHCSKQLKHILDKVRNKWGIFMAYDLGTFGSDGYYARDDQRLTPLRDQIFLDVFNGSIQVQQRDRMLIEAADGVTDRGFIAILEKTIALQADCLIVLGTRSSFVVSSASLYFSLHPYNTCAVSVCSEKLSNIDKTKFTSSDIPDEVLH